MDTELIWPGTLSLLLVWGAVSDIKSRILPNWLAAVLLLLGLAYAFTSGGLTGLGWHAAHFAVALIAGMGLFAAKIFGGGDVKFYAGMASFFPLSMGLDLLLYVVLVGGALAIIWLVGKWIIPGIKEITKGIYGKLPYGVAIAAGGISLAWSTPIAAWHQ